MPRRASRTCSARNAAEDGDTDDDDDNDDEDLHSHATNDSSTIAGEQDTMKIDLDGPTTATSSAAPSLDKAGGAMVGVTSGAEVTTTSPVRAGRSRPEAVPAAVQDHVGVAEIALAVRARAELRDRPRKRRTCRRS